MKESPPDILQERIRSADPTGLSSYKLIDLFFKIVQWTVFAGLIRAIGIKSGTWSVWALGWVMLITILVFVCRVVTKVLNGVYKPGNFQTRLDRWFAYTTSLVMTVTITLWIGQHLVLAASLVVSFYLSK